MGMAMRIGILSLPTTYLLLSAYAIVLQYDWRVWLYLAHPIVAYVLLFGSGEEALKYWAAAAARPDAILLNFKRLCMELTFSVAEDFYYVSLIPLKFVMDGSRHFSRTRGIATAAFSFLHIFLLLVTHLYQCHWQELHEHAMRLGAWEPSRRGGSGAVSWIKTQTWVRGTVVRHRKKTYIALGEQNSAEPGSRLPVYFWQLFRDPTFMLSIVVAAQSMLLLFLLVIVLA
eukprot:UC1_evm1s147